MSSEEDVANLGAALRRRSSSEVDGVPQMLQRPVPSLSMRSAPVSRQKLKMTEETRTSSAAVQTVVSVHPSPIRNKASYTYYEPKDEVEGIIRQFSKEGRNLFEVRLFGDKTKEITLKSLLQLPGGLEAWKSLNSIHDFNESSSDTINDNMKLRNRSSRVGISDFVDISTINLSSSDEDDSSALDVAKPHRNRPRVSMRRRSRSGHSSRTRPHQSDLVEFSPSDDESGDDLRRRKRKRKVIQEPLRRSKRPSRPLQAFDGEDEEDITEETDSDIVQSEVLLGRKRKRPSRRTEDLRQNGTRKSDRSTRATNNMQEADVDDIYRYDSEPKAAVQKMTVVREIFAPLSRGNLFRSRHVEGCEVCFDGPSVASLIYCQGCSLAYHKNCLGNRSTRDHLVTKIGDENFVLQCKRCINTYKRKDPLAPDLSKCQDCAQAGASCKPFRHAKTTAQEMKDREENGGEDPVISVLSELINNAHNVLFRCTKCSRAWHYHHLPPMSQYIMNIDRDDEETAEERCREYSGKWLCKECDSMGSQKVGTVVAWRPSDVEAYHPGAACGTINEDEKQYLVKFEEQSFFRAAWHSGAWTWGVTVGSMRKAFFKREDGPKMRTEDAIPEEFLRIDIVLDIKFTSFVDVHTEEIDKARIKEVERALVKYKGLGYEDVVWEKVPTPEDGDRWLDFVTAYDNWVAGRYIRCPKQAPLKARLEKVRSTPFAKLEREKQPENVVGGELIKYQLNGLNWLYYQWYSQNNCILADEMGLGKTIQVISFLATLIQEHNCFPFIIVVPNSTCANWRREIKQWAPSLRVVAYFGSSAARDMAYRYEMYPEASKDIRCHIVVTSYETATDDSCRKVFHNTSWAGLIVDEGQRLKNDKSQLYTALASMRAPFRLLMTGTPLQNNTRELFNLLQFLDDSIDAAKLEEKYSEMTAENIKELHDQLRPFILRRTKAQVLTFLPPLSQIIVPISMCHLQKQLYKLILSKRPELLKTLFTSDKTLKQQERANLSNILMQLRKCLCHPFIYSREIEERTDKAAVSHRNLVEASAKLGMLEMLLPKLKERGHRVLIFSQFLDMLTLLEDFLDGMQLAYQRLDGSMGSLEKQKRIDQFNAPDSSLFAFLLSTRAGGVGINLATADTVIILDPDWNPHQDIQAVARAHRIGQRKKVLCLQFMTRSSVEEKIMQMGRKKMALDHVVVEQLDSQDMEDHDVESILKFGAAELFNDDGANSDIRYDDASVNKLLDRSQIESTKISSDNSAESQFSFARVWANDKGYLQDDFDIADEVAPDPGVWDKILKERQAAAAAEAAARDGVMGRGRRTKAAVDYVLERDGIDIASIAETEVGEDAAAKLSSTKMSQKTRRKSRADSGSDTDFQASSGGSDDESTIPDIDADHDGGVIQEQSIKENEKSLSKSPDISSKLHPAVLDTNGVTQPNHLRVEASNSSSGPINSHANFSSSTAQPPLVKAQKTDMTATKSFKRAKIPTQSHTTPILSSLNGAKCPACYQSHPQGACKLKAAGAEHCGLCGLAHYGYSRTCPHIRSETQVREMLLALKSSPESKDLVDLAVKYLRGVKGALVQQKRRDREKELLEKEGTSLSVPGADKLLSESQSSQRVSTGSSDAAQKRAQDEYLNFRRSHDAPLTNPYPSNSHPTGLGIDSQGPPQTHRILQTHGIDAAPDDGKVEVALRGYLGH